ncbi:hypothetical protein Hanom_Chr03g00216551 [Helianthus anomalus]
MGSSSGGSDPLANSEKVECERVVDVGDCMGFSHAHDNDHMCPNSQIPRAADIEGPPYVFDNNIPQVSVVYSPKSPVGPPSLMNLQNPCYITNMPKYRKSTVSPLVPAQPFLTPDLNEGPGLMEDNDTDIALGSDPFNLEELFRLEASKGEKTMESGTV